jgi:hypothetical protein
MLNPCILLSRNSNVSGVLQNAAIIPTTTVIPLAMELPLPTAKLITPMIIIAIATLTKYIIIVLMIRVDVSDMDMYG